MALPYQFQRERPSPLPLRLQGRYTGDRLLGSRAVRCVEWAFATSAELSSMADRIAVAARFFASPEWMCERMSRERAQFDVLIVGGGPAGIAAATRAAECGVRVGLVDDNPAFGGQIWRKEFETGNDPTATRWRDLLAHREVARLNGLRVFDHSEPGVLLTEGLEKVCELRYENLILATGARERFLPFPGWTLPNVMGAGGLQAMVKAGLPIRGKRVVVAGTGPLLLAVAANLRKHGAEVLMICEQAPWGRVAAFAFAMAMFPEKISQALQLRKELSGIPIATNSYPITASGNQKLESVTISRGSRSETLKCDYLACGFHLVPNIELQALLGCEIRNGFVVVDDFQQTSVENCFSAGEPTAIGGIELALVEGQIAGLAAADRLSDARKLFGQRRHARRFARLLERTFSLRCELKNLSKPETIVCRCEDVSYLRLQPHTSWRAAKLHTRCGMGPCQGRVCGPATQFLFDWKPESVRPPVFPARVESMTSQTRTQM